MKYIAFDAPGPPSVLRVAEGPRPEYGADDVLIEVEAAGVARADALQRQGVYPPPAGASPILGLEVSGSIVAVGKNVEDLHVGDSVVALCNGGGYAEYVAVHRGSVLPLPKQWSFVEGATLPENAFTVYDNLFTRARLRRGETLLVHGASSGIGTLAIMFARAFGVRVIATAGSDAKCQACIDHGAEVAINYRTHDFVECVMDTTQGSGASVILDIVGGDYIERDLRCLALDGRIACIATAGGREATIDLGRLLSRRATLFGSSLRARTPLEKAAIARELADRIWPLLPARHPIAPVIDSLFTFADAPKAHARLESSQHIGKIVLVPDPPDSTANQSGTLK